MTRINVVEPKELTDQHLLAEYREIRLLCSNLVRTLNCSVGFQERKVPKQFTLNTGHCYFFYNKGEYIRKRYEALREELHFRGIDASLDFPRENWPDELMNDWIPTERDRNIVRERIDIRISERPNWYRYCGELIGR